MITRGFKRIVYGMMTMIIWLQMVGFGSFAFAKELKDVKYVPDSIQIIPQVKPEGETAIKDAYTDLTSKESQYQFWDKYNDKANSADFDPSKPEWLANSLASGIMSWDTIIAYASVIIEFISNIGLVVGAWFIIYSGYEYAIHGLGGAEGKTNAIKNAFIGITVITLSYGIFRLLTRIFIE